MIMARYYPADSTFIPPTLCESAHIFLDAVEAVVLDVPATIADEPEARSRFLRRLPAAAWEEAGGRRLW
jgi:hypothetical protein